MNCPLLLDRFIEFSSHQRNLETLMIEVYKIISQIASPVMNSLFVFQENMHNRSSRPEVFCKKGVLRNFAKFTGKQSDMVWKLFQIDYLCGCKFTTKNSNHKSLFKMNGEICACRLRKVYKPNEGFI